MRRETRQLSLAEALVGGGKGGARLERIAGALDWSELDALMAELRSASTGRPGWPPLVDAEGAAAGAVVRAVATPSSRTRSPTG